MPATHDDWRLQGQDAWLARRHLTWRTWTSPRPGWDHDHCEFCWDVFGGLEFEDVVPAGWVTDDDLHWVCPTCFADFNDRFHWTIEGSSGPPRPRD